MGRFAREIGRTKRFTLQVVGFTFEAPGDGTLEVRPADKAARESMVALAVNPAWGQPDYDPVLDASWSLEDPDDEGWGRIIDTFLEAASRARGLVGSTIDWNGAKARLDRIAYRVVEDGDGLYWVTDADGPDQPGEYRLAPGFASPLEDRALADAIVHLLNFATNHGDGQVAELVKRTRASCEWIRELVALLPDDPNELFRMRADQLGALSGTAQRLANDLRAAAGARQALAEQFEELSAMMPLADQFAPDSIGLGDLTPATKGA